MGLLGRVLRELECSLVPLPFCLAYHRHRPAPTPATSSRSSTSRVPDAPLRQRVLAALRGSLVPLASRQVARRLRERPAAVNGALRALRRRGQAEQDPRLAEHHRVHGRVVRVSPWRAVAVGMLACLSFGCVTSRDLDLLSGTVRNVETSLGDVRSVLHDFQATDADVAEAVDGLGTALGGLGTSLEQVKDQVAQRTAEAVDQGRELVEELGIPGALTALGMFLLNLMRNSTRRRELDRVEGRIVQGSGHAA